MTLALLTGAGAGLGLLVLLRALFPPQEPLAALLARLAGTAPPPARAEPSAGWRGGLAATAGRPAARFLRSLGVELPGLRHDLALLGRPLELHLAEKAGLALLGLLLAPATAALMALGGARLPAAVPAWAALALAASGFAAPDLGVRVEAAGRRQDFRHALSSFLDLTVIGLAAGGGVESALEGAASVVQGWSGGQLRQALAAARLRREPPWAALGQLGADLGVGELEELAASVSLAGTEGAKVRAALAAKATSLRAHLLAEAEAGAQAASERMSLPVVLLYAGFLLFLAFPAVMRVLTAT